MNTPISISEAVEILRNLSTEEASADPRMQELIETIDDIATDLLKDKSNDYLAGIASMAQAMAFGGMIKVLVDEGDLLGAMKLMSIMQSDTMIQLSALVFKFSVGLAAYEELH